MAKKKKKTKKKSNKVALYAGAAFLFMVAVIGGVNFVGGQELAAADVPSTCTIVKWDVHIDTADGSNARYYPQLTIAHTVDGKRYERVDRGPQSSTQSDAFAVAKSYKIGSEQPCHYVSGSPDVVVVFPQSGSIPYVWLGFGLVALAIGGIVFAQARKAA